MKLCAKTQNLVENNLCLKIMTVFVDKEWANLRKRDGSEAIFVPRASTSWGRRNDRGSICLSEGKINVLTR